jgi:hypothetical protein
MHWHFHWQDLWIFGREIIGVLVALAGAAWAAYLRWSSFAWPEIQGTVEHYRIVPFGRTDPDNNGIAFSYTVNGEYYAGQLAVTSPYRFPKTEEDLARVYPRGGKIRVRYKPKDPSVYVAFRAEIPPKSAYFPPRDDPR